MIIWYLVEGLWFILGGTLMSEKILSNRSNRIISSRVVFTFENQLKQPEDKKYAR